MKDCKRFRPDQRLRKQDSFRNLVEKGSFARGRFFYVWAAPQQELQEKKGMGRPALGIVVNRKTQARAADRNTLKRRVREIFREKQGELKDGIAVLVKAKEGSPLPGLQAAGDDLAELFKKCGAVK